MKRITFLFLICFYFPHIAYSQSYLHTEGKYIYNGTGEEVLLRGIGTGNWMLQEGYMMQTSDIAGTQYEFMERLIQTIGVEKTDSFYNAWLAYHFTRTDVDSLKSWGYNSVRVAMHYKWFTPPIEEEPVEGEITWIDKGFVILDSLLGWCGDNEMYLILDLHGAPGGQGEDANISDYDSTKPSLWESEQNKQKTIALWRKLAERYNEEPWIGGYDLINETNWSFTEANNAPLWDLFIDITEAIREVDTNHIIILEGNWFANDYTGIPSPWDDNLVFSFHKYWNYNTLSEINWMINMRNTYNIPIWLGETGENSNTWFTNLVALLESQKIGWSWWPVKKPGVNNPLRVVVNEDYTNLIEYWKGNAPASTEEEAFQAVLKFAEQHKIENCVYQKDVVDALFRQPYIYSSIPYTNHKPGQTIFVTDYDLGRNNIAYFDNDTANYHLSQNNVYTAWNKGYSYRNDGVDIEACTDSDETNGYNVGWTESDEWLTYTITTDSAAVYKLSVRSASGSNGGKIRFLANDVPVTGIVDLPATGGWQNWTTIEVENVILPAGTVQIKLYIVQEGVNLNYFKFTNPVSISSVDLEAVYTETNIEGSEIHLYVNKEITSSGEEISLAEFEIRSDNNPITINNLILDTESSKLLVINLAEPIYYGNDITISYNGNSVQSNSDTLQAFSSMAVSNLLPIRYNIPGRIQAEEFQINYGLELEDCSDVGGGYNTGYANAGDYLDYLIHVTSSGHYSLNFRVATTASNAEVVVLVGEDDVFTALDTIRFNATGGWQNWSTQSGDVYLEEGRYTFRIMVKQGEHNLNWFEFTAFTSVNSFEDLKDICVFPIPASKQVSFKFHNSNKGHLNLAIYNIKGSLIIYRQYTDTTIITIDTSNWSDGIYYYIVSDDLEIIAQDQLLIQ